MAESNNQANLSPTKQPNQEKLPRLKAAFRNRYVLNFSEKLFLIFAKDLIRWLETWLN